MAAQPLAPTSLERTEALQTSNDRNPGTLQVFQKKNRDFYLITKNKMKHRTGIDFIDALQDVGAADGTKYGDHIELRLRTSDSPGHFKITGTLDQVRRQTTAIIDRFGTPELQKLISSL